MCVVDLRLERVANVLITGFNMVILDKKNRNYLNVRLPRLEI